MLIPSLSVVRRGEARGVGDLRGLAGMVPAVGALHPRHPTRTKRPFLVLFAAVLLMACERLPLLSTGANVSQVDAGAGPSPNPVTPQARFHRHVCGSIVEPNRGLEWFVGPDETMSYGAALTWAEKLAACDGSWRMPTQEELLPLFDRNHNAGSGFESKGQRFVAHLDPLFAGIGGGSWVWAASSPTGPNAVAINFNIRKEVTLPRVQEKYTVRAFAVRTTPARESAQSEQVEPDIRVVHAGGSGSVLSGSPVVAVTEPDIREAGLGTSTKESIRLVLEAGLLAHAGVTVVADSRLRAELRQRKRSSYEDCYDESCQIELGKAVAARMLLNSRIIREPGPQCSLSLRLLDLQTETTKAAVFVQSHTECGPKVGGALAAAAVDAFPGAKGAAAGGQSTPPSAAGGSLPTAVASVPLRTAPTDTTADTQYTRHLEEHLKCLANPDPSAVTDTSKATVGYIAEICRALEPEYRLPEAIPPGQLKSLKLGVLLFIEPDGVIREFYFVEAHPNEAFMKALQSLLKSVQLPPPPRAEAKRFQTYGVKVVFRT